MEPFVGALNFHIWREVCGYELMNLRQHLFFPHYPNENFKQPITEFQIEDNSSDYGQVIFGQIIQDYQEIRQGSSPQIMSSSRVILLVLSWKNPNGAARFQPYWFIGGWEKMHVVFS